MSFGHDDPHSMRIEEAKRIVQSRKKSAIFWALFNVALLIGGILSFVIIEFPLLLIGLVIFCPYSIGKNLWKLHKAQKAFNELNQY